MESGLASSNATTDRLKWSLPIVCGALAVCPVSVFEMINSSGHPLSDKKSGPIKEPDRIVCMACEVQCPTKAIKITPK